MELAVVDLDTSIDEQARTLGEACEHLGFFAVPLAAVDRRITDPAWDAAAEFFALPEREKRRIEFPEPGYPYGYSPFRFESLARSIDGADPTGPDLKESLSVGPDCGTWGPAADPWIGSPSLWPDHPSELRVAWIAYYRELASLSEHLMSVMAVALYLPPDYFSSMIDRPIASMRAINYPATTGDHGRSIRAGAHTDYGTLTILRTTAVPGLEVQQPNGTWAPVAPNPELLVVNLGDSVAQWTNDRWRSTMHRVTMTDPSPRQSMAFFHMANWDAVIECVPSCRPEEGAPSHPPVQAGPWLKQKFQSTVT